MSAMLGSSRIISLLLVHACLPLVVAVAHPEGFSGMHVTVEAERIRAAITLHTRDLDGWFPPGRYPDYVADVTHEMERSLGEIVELQFDGQPQTVVAVKAFLLEVGLIEIDVDFSLPQAAESVELLVWSKHLIRMPRGHQQLLFVEDRRWVVAATDEGVMRLDDVLTAERDAAAVMLPPTGNAKASPARASPRNASPRNASPRNASPRNASPRNASPRNASPRNASPRNASPRNASQSAQDLDRSPDDQAAASELSHEDVEAKSNPRDTSRQPKAGKATDRPTSRISFFWFGVEHIMTGYDHLLFLAALLLACATFSEAATIITCFTLAHSITLALAALDVVRLPGSIVEPLIALSIVYIAIENLSRTPSLWPRATVTCLFGLVHGLGFASALRDIGLGTMPGGVVWPLLRFNLGVEAGQLAVAAVLLPLLWWAKRSERGSRMLVPVGSVMVALIGGYWLVTRVASQFVTG